VSIGPAVDHGVGTDGLGITEHADARTGQPFSGTLSTSLPSAIFTLSGTAAATVSGSTFSGPTHHPLPTSQTQAFGRERADHHLKDKKSIRRNPTAGSVT
jgi:hypothetical protein